MSRMVARALDVCVTRFDTADGYGTPGRSLGGGSRRGARRKDVVILTKFAYLGQGPHGPHAPRDASRRHVMRAVEASLKRLGTDPLTPMEETLRAMDDIVRSGKVRYIAISSHSAVLPVRSAGSMIVGH
jgi:1-deoxyxylulose-5-phosphate synthase